MSTAEPLSRADRGQTTRPPARRQTITLGQAARVFWRRPTPWILGLLTLAGLAARVIAGAWTWWDLALVGGMVAAQPLIEWVIHVVLLHWRPRAVAGRTVDFLVSRKHREHHADPRALDLIFIPLRTLVKAIAASAIVGLVLLPRPLGLTYLTVQALIGTVYEWTHYLVHTDYRPRTRYYRAIWRNHRLHHYKNERYWFTVTSQGTADRLLGTSPDPTSVATSPTARSLHATVG